METVANDEDGCSCARGPVRGVLDAAGRESAVCSGSICQVGQTKSPTQLGVRCDRAPNESFEWRRRRWQINPVAGSATMTFIDGRRVQTTNGQYPDASGQIGGGFQGFVWRRQTVRGRQCDCYEAASTRVRGGRLSDAAKTRRGSVLGKAGAPDETRSGKLARTGGRGYAGRDYRWRCGRRRRVWREARR